MFTSIFASSNAIRAVILNVGKNPPNCTILDSWVFENFILVDEPFSKVLRSLETCVLVNDNLYRRSVWSLDSATTFYKRFKVAWVPFFILDFNLLSCELDNSIFKVLYLVILCWCFIKAKLIYNTTTVPFEKPKIVLASSKVKHIVVSAAQCLLKSITISL